MEPTGQPMDPDQMQWWQFLTSGPFYAICPEERVRFATGARPSAAPSGVLKLRDSFVAEHRPAADDNPQYIMVQVDMGQAAQRQPSRGATPISDGGGRIMASPSPVPPSDPALSRIPTPLSEANPAAVMEGKMRKLARLDVVEFEELLPLPFQPPTLLAYLSDQLVAMFMVAQYVVTMLISLMTALAEVNKFGEASESSGFLSLIKLILVLYPLLTLSLLLISFAEVNVRKMMYYRLMSLGIILDWKDAPLFRAWFMWYWVSSWVVVNIWTVYAAVVSRRDSGSPAFTCWVVVNMQTLLLFNFWRVKVAAVEESLVTVSDFIERAPTAAKALVEDADVIREADFARAVLAVHYKLLRYDVAAGVGSEESLLELAELRRTKRVEYGHRVHRSGEESLDLRQVLRDVDAAVGGGARPRTWLAAFFRQLGGLLEREVLEKLYGLTFVFLVLVRRVRSKRLHVWPFRADLPYFAALAVCCALCLLLVLGVEGYSLFLAMGGADRSTELVFGSADCRSCYSRLYRSGRSCQASGFCFLEPARAAFCLASNLVSSPQLYGLPGDEVAALSRGTCPALLNATLPQLF